MIDKKKKRNHGAGRSSFGLVDQNRLFSKLGLSRGITFLDFGCGRGDYAMVAAEIIGPGDWSTVLTSGRRESLP